MTPGARLLRCSRRQVARPLRPLRPRGRGRLTRLVAGGLFSAGGLGHHPPLRSALLLAAPGLQAAASPLAGLWRQRKASPLPQASGGASAPRRRAGARGRRGRPHPPPLGLSGKPRRPGAAAPPAGHRLLPALARPSLASDPVPDTTGSGSGTAGLGATGWGPRGRASTCSLREPRLHPRVAGSHLSQSLTAQACAGASLGLLTLLQTWTSGGAWAQHAPLHSHPSTP